MKKLFMVLSFLLVGGMLFGCGTTNEASAPDNTLQKYNITGSLQGKIMDAVTGAGIGGSDLKVFLIQGTSDRTPNKLITNPNDPLVGEYAFSGIPVDINTGEIIYRVAAIKPGYQLFEADVELSAVINLTNNTVIDNVYNKIGDIYLYPLGSTAGDVSVYVYDPNGLPIPNATVFLKQNVTNNNIIANTGDRLNPTAGLYPELNATTNAAGLATFTSGTLTLGGNYNAVVPGMTFNGEQLRTSTSAPFFVGTNSTDQVVNMTAATGAPILFAVSASNSVPGTITPSGVLTITFNQPIILSTATFNVALSGGSGGVLGSPTVTGVLSNGNTTLTLTPNITTAPTAKGAFLIYTYGGTIYLQNSQEPTTFTLFTGTPSDVKNITTNAAVSGLVQLTSY
jgi:hypothetical protein